MELLEAFNLLSAALAEEVFCNPKDTQTDKWKAEIHTIKGYVGDPAVLRDSMVAEECPEPAKAGLAAPWDLYKCAEHTFPYQTHHVVPKALLPGHEVCVWLTDTPKKNPTKYKLKGDTNYSIDNWENGYFMPFASTTRQWGKNTSAKSLICFEMMRRTKTQLHQGNHSSSDYLEEDGLETEGYNAETNKLLTLISARMATHVDGCDTCAKKAGGKIEVQPMESVVRAMYLVSSLLIALIDFNRIFVSQRAADYFANNHDANNNVRHRPDSQPFI